MVRNSRNCNFISTDKPKVVTIRSREKRGGL